MGKPKVVCIVGATATGKSDFGVWVAKQFGGEVLSADSMQVYRGMDIGTAKLTEDEMDGVVHHLIDIALPSESFTVSDWVREADLVIGQLHAAGKLPIVVGGTGLYIRAITEDLDFAEQAGSTEVREKWRSYYEQYGGEALYQALMAVDEKSALRLHPNDVRRVIRALEVYELGQRRLSDTYDWTKRGGRYETLQIGLKMPRQELYERVNQRVDDMIAKGLVREVEELLQNGTKPEAQSIQAIGYKELVSYLNGNLTFDEAVSQIKQNTRRFVKRQTSWFACDERIIWLDTDAETGLSFETKQYAKDKIAKFLAGIRADVRE